MQCRESFCDVSPQVTGERCSNAREDAGGRPSVFEVSTKFGGPQALLRLYAPRRCNSFRPSAALSMPIVAAATPEVPISPSAAALSRSIDDILGSPPGGGSEATLVLRDRPAGITRLGLVLEPWPGLATWTEREGVDGLFLHRHWSLKPGLLPPDAAVVANHEGFDRRFALGQAPELFVGLGMRPLASLPDRDGYPLGAVAEGPAGTLESLRARLLAVFGGVEAELASHERRLITRIALARAMTAELVLESAGWGAQAYVTGQLRQPGRRAAAECGLHVFAVGHRRSETWALSGLAGQLRLRWPGLTTCIPSVAHPVEPAGPAG